MISIRGILKLLIKDNKNMSNHIPDEVKNKDKEPPAAETLKPKVDNNSSYQENNTKPAEHKLTKRVGRMTYRPSHKATFIGIAVVVAILAINAGMIAFVMNSQTSPETDVNRNQVTISSEALDKLGVSRNAVGSVGTELVVGPDSKFNGEVTVAGGVNIAGNLKLNSKFSATDASLAKLEAGDTVIGKLNVSGDGTLSNLNLRNDFTVVGLTRLQGPVNVAQLLTVSNSVNVSGNLAVGGTLSARSFQASNLVSDTTLTIGDI